MSAEATGWVWKYSPYSGAQLLVHLAIADVVNDTHDNEFWMTGAKLAAKAKVSRNTVTTTLSDLVARGLMQLLESGAEHRRPSRFRFLMPASALTALAAPVDNTGTSATTARDMRAGSATTSAISNDSHARSARTDPNRDNPRSQAEVFPQSGDPGCVRCHGTGRFYNGSAGFDVACSCVQRADEHPDQPTAPPWKALGMTYAQWSEFVEHHPIEASS